MPCQSERTRHLPHLPVCHFRLRPHLLWSHKPQEWAHAPQEISCIPCVVDFEWTFCPITPWSGPISQRILSSLRKGVGVLCCTSLLPTHPHTPRVAHLWLLANAAVWCSSYTCLLLDKAQHIKQGSPPRFFVFFSQAKGRKKSKNTMALCPGIRQSKCCLLFPFSSVRVRLIKLMKGGFPEQLQLRVCNPGDAVSQAAMRLLCGPQLSKWVCASPLITSTAPADFLSLWKILQELATFPVLSATDAPHSVVVWCWLHNRQCPKQSCWRPEAMNTLDT